MSAGALVHERAQHGEGTAPERSPLVFAAVYAEHFDFVWRSLRHLGVPESGLDDAVQDLWLTVHRRLPTFERRSSLTTWLFGIAINVSRARRRQHARSSSAEPLPDALASSAPDPERVAVGHATWRLVQEFLETLPEQSRAIFVSALLENFTPRETAEAVQIDVETVYKRVRALRRAFQRRLGHSEESLR